MGKKKKRRKKMPKVKWPDLAEQWFNAEECKWPSLAPDGRQQRNFKAYVTKKEYWLN